MELALDSSTDIMGLALLEQGEVRAELTWYSGQNHARQLFPALDGLLARAGASFSAIQAIFVARGPGSFNGLRVGIAATKGLARALAAPVLGVSTLEAEAYPFRSWGLPICPVHPAGRGELAVALFQEQEGEWARLWEEQLLTPQDLLARLTGRTLFCGEPPPAFLELLGATAVVPSPAARLRRAGPLGELGWSRLSQGQRDDPATLQPIYLHRPPITQPKPPAPSPTKEEK